MPTTIIFQGQHYEHPEDLPPEARQKYEQAMRKLDADGNGVPDVLDLNNNATGLLFDKALLPNKIVINGQEYHSIEELPPEFRQVYERLLKDEDQNGIPDAFQGSFVDTLKALGSAAREAQSVARQAQMPPAVNEQASTYQQSPAIPSGGSYTAPVMDPVIQETRPPIALWIVGTIILVLLCAGGAFLVSLLNH